MEMMSLSALAATHPLSAVLATIKANSSANARALSDEIGLEELTITKLGRALGIAPPGVYRHVADLRDLRGAIARQAASAAITVLPEPTSP